MKQKCPAELNSRVIRISVGDYALLTDISRRAGVTIAEALPMALHNLETRPEAPGSPLQIPLLPVAVTLVTNESHYEQALEETARLNDSIANLEERKTFLESSDHKNEIIRKFLRNMNRDNFHEIGLKLGFLEDVEAGSEDTEVIEDHSGEEQVLLVSKDKPEDMTGWEYSKQQDLYIKVERRRE